MPNVPLHVILVTNDQNASRTRNYENASNGEIVVAIRLLHLGLSQGLSFIYGMVIHPRLLGWKKKFKYPRLGLKKTKMHTEL